jgi:HK97 family phage major capsid protein
MRDKWNKGGESTSALKERLGELRTAAKALTDENLAIAAAAKASEEVEVDVTNDAGEVVKQKVPVVRVDTEQRERFDRNMKSIKEEIRPEIERIEQMLELAEWGDSPAKASVANAANVAAIAEALRSGSREELKNLADRLFESDGWKAMRDMAPGERKMRFDVPSLSRKDVYSDLPSGDPGSFGRVQRDPIVPQAFRTFRVRDLFPVVRTDAAAIEFFRVTGFNNQASTVGERTGNEFALKPHSNLSVEGLAATVKTIAHWEVAHRNVLDDEPVLRGIIENELMYGLQLTEDAQILNGAGTGNDLLGILNTPGIQEITQGTAPSTADDRSIDVVRRAITLTFLSNYEATGVVLHPLDWEEMELGRDGDGRYLLYAVAGSTGAEPRLWRLPVVQTPALDEDTGLVGAFGLGATLYDRMQANIRIAEQHDDYFIRNAVLILAEERLAMAVKRPEAFVKMDGLETAQV